MRPAASYGETTSDGCKKASRPRAQRIGWLKLCEAQSPTESAEGRAVTATVVRLQEELSPSISEEAKSDFRAILSLIDSEPVEDGRTHPAERLLARFAERHSRVCLLAVTLHWWPPIGDSRMASLLRLLGRNPNLTTPPARRALVQHGLKSESEDVRDAVAQAAELWNDVGLVDVLKKHEERSPWLAAYMRDVANSLAG